MTENSISEEPLKTDCGGNQVLLQICQEKRNECKAYLKIRMVPRDQLFSDKIFAKITLDIKIVGKFPSNGVYDPILHH